MDSFLRFRYDMKCTLKFSKTTRAQAVAAKLGLKPSFE